MTVNVTLNNGIQMPALGFGVFQTPPDVTAQAVGTALATGYRLSTPLPRMATNAKSARPYATRAWP